MEDGDRAAKQAATVTELERRLVEAARASRALADSERLYRALFEGTATAVTIRTLEDQTFVDCNPAALRLYRAESVEQLRGKTVRDLSAERQPDGALSEEALRVHVTRAIETGLARVEWTARRLDGEIFVADIRIAILELEGGRRVMQTIIEDITERTAAARARAEAEAALRASEERYRMLVERSRDAIFSLDYAGKCVFASPAAEQLFGYTAAEWPGMDVMSAIVPEEHPRLQTAMAAARKGLPGLPEEWSMRHKDGSIIRVEAARSPIYDDAGRVVGAQVIVRDVSERHRAEQMREAAARELSRAREEAVAASRAKSAFVANMSHELRTPLNGVIGMVDLLARTTLDARQKRYVDVARSSANLLLSVISDILDFSKIEAGKLDLERIELTFADLVEEVATVLELAAEDKGIELTCQSDAALARPLVGDPARIRQVLVNLVSNAIKFTASGEVGVHARVVERREHDVLVRVEVRDTGVGIPADAKEKLFRPFTQVDASTTREHGGSGLGLAICRELAVRMGGEIGVDSVPGRGSRFWFTVALGHGPPASLRVMVDARLDGLRVLAVDDNATNREILRAHLTAAGLRADVSASGPDALDRLAEAVDEGDPFVLAVLDQQMPEMDGLELARRIKTDARLAGTRLVMLGSIGQPLNPAELEALGVVTWATKPIWRSRILRALAAALDDTTTFDAGPESRRSRDLETERPAAGQRTRVLLVEDTPVNAEVVTEILRGAGYAVEVASDGLQALERVRREAFDLVLMDCQLPGIDGYEAARRIRVLESTGTTPRGRLRRVPIVALTASA
ncbi:MAG TPA: PAS domain S-box protein, partial [Polyangiaceae bacterium]|nr:PAS domain S-box protein [Polyangiaceae bacterium]